MNRAAVLRKPNFHWATDSDALLFKHKREQILNPPLSTGVVPLPAIVLEHSVVARSA